MTTIADQLKGIKFDFAAYGKLPTREYVQLFKSGTGIQKEWDKLNMIRRNLKILDRYLKENKNETLSDWLKKVNEEGIANIVIDKIGKYNNETGGISSYFFNLQNFYDGEERKYDMMELKEDVPIEIGSELMRMREERHEKRKTRLKTRKLSLKDLKANGKGYIQVDLGEPSEDNLSVAAPDEKKASAEEKKKDESTPQQKVNKAASILINLAGLTIGIAVVYGIVTVVTTKAK